MNVPKADIGEIMAGEVGKAQLTAEEAAAIVQGTDDGELEQRAWDKLVLIAGVSYES